MRVAEQIVTNVAKMKVNAGTDAWYGSVSIGVATTTNAKTSAADLIKKADQAVYAAIEAGKGCAREAQLT